MTACEEYVPRFLVGSLRGRRPNAIAVEIAGTYPRGHRELSLDPECMHETTVFTVCAALFRIRSPVLLTLLPTQFQCSCAGRASRPRRSGWAGCARGTEGVHRPSEPSEDPAQNGHPGAARPRRRGRPCRQTRTTRVFLCGVARGTPGDRKGTRYMFQCTE